MKLVVCGCSANVVVIFFFFSAKIHRSIISFMVGKLAFDRSNLRSTVCVEQVGNTDFFFFFCRIRGKREKSSHRLGDDFVNNTCRHHLI